MAGWRGIELRWGDGFYVGGILIISAPKMQQVKIVGFVRECSKSHAYKERASPVLRGLFTRKSFFLKTNLG